MTKDQLFKAIDKWENLGLVIEQINCSEEYFGMLMDIALNDNRPNTWRAAWIADKIHDNQPRFILPHIENMVEWVLKSSNKGKLRHFLKLISLNEIPIQFHTLLLDFCLNIVVSDKEPPAIRVHAMQTLYKLSEYEPELKHEILAIIENEMEFHPTPGILSRGQKLTDKLRRQIKNCE
jgi:hypothetical protein